MENINLNSLSEKEISEQGKNIQGVFQGIATESYLTTTKLLEMGVSFDLLSEKIRIHMLNHHRLILEITETEKALSLLNTQLITGGIHADDFVSKSHAIAEKLAFLKSEASASKYSFGEDLLGKYDEKKNADTLSKYQGYFSKLISLYNSYVSDKEILDNQLRKFQSNGNEVEIAMLDESISKLNEKYSESLQALATDNNGVLKNLFGDLSKVAKSEIEKAIEAADIIIQDLDEKQRTGRATSAELDMRDKLRTARSNAEDSTGKSWWDASGKISENLTNIKLDEQLKSFGTSFTGLGETFNTLSEKGGDTLNVLGNVFTAAGEISNGAGEIAGGILQMGTNPIAGAAGILKGVTSIIKSIGSRIAENKKILKEYKENQAVELSKELEYNKLMRERLRIAEKITLTSRENYITQKELINLQKKQSQSDYDRIFADLQGEQYIEETKYKNGTWFRKAKTWNEYGSLAGKNYEEIEKLYEEGKLDKKAETLFKQLKSLHSEQEKLEEELKNLEQERKETWTGTTTDAIIDSISQGFIDGKKSAKDFASDFEDMMRNAMLQSIKMKFVSEKLQAWYDDFTDKSESDGTLTKEEIKKLEENYNDIITNAFEQVKVMEQMTGLSFATITTDSSVAQKGLASITQDTASELNGRFGVIQTATCKIQDIIEKAALQWIDIAENTRYCRKLETMEKDMNSMKNDINSMALKGIRLIR